MKLNYDFQLKDFNETQSKHLGQIKRLKEAIKKLNSESIYGFEVWDNFLENVEYRAKNTPFFNYNLYEKDSWVNKLSPKRRLRMVKSYINGQTREQIIEELKARNWPESWDTAFYCLYYKKINRIMKDLAKNYGF